MFLKVLNQEPPLFVPKTAKKRPQIFFFKTATILVKSATIWDFFHFAQSWKWPTMPFYCIFMWQFLTEQLKTAKNSKSNTFARFYLPSGLKSTRPKNFLAPQGSPKPPLWLQTATFRNTDCANDSALELYLLSSVDFI